MAEVISGDKIARHNVDKYSFKVLAIGGSGTKKQKPPFIKETPQQTQTQEAPSDETVKESQENRKKQDSKDSIIESLLKKTDEMSSNFIKLQMKLEAMQEEHKRELEHIKQSAFEEGFAKGKESAKEEFDAKFDETLKLFSDSISKLESKATEYNTALESLKKELATAAIDIAKEVVATELKERSSEIALVLADSLIDDLQQAAKITLKVNPQDFTYVSQHLEHLRHVHVVADNAVSPGGVIAVSDIENIDAQIQKRFEKVKRVILSE